MRRNIARSQGLHQRRSCCHHSASGGFGPWRP